MLAFVVGSIFSPQLRVQYNFANSMAALHSLCQGEAHIAGMHLYDPETGEHNTPFVREVLGARKAVLITLGVWEEGLLSSTPSSQTNPDQHSQFSII